MSRTASPSAQARANAALWEPGGLVDAYASRELRPVEVMILVRYRDDFSGRVLELGCGAGRLTGYLAALARETHALDVSPAMVEYSRRAYPRATFEVGDLRDLSRYPPAGFDVVVAGFNVLDVLDEIERPPVLAAIRDLLSVGGLLVFSAHNLHYAPSGAVASARDRSLPWMLANARRVPRRMLNRRRMRPHERRGDGFAIVNDDGHDFATLHYHVTREEQERQLAELGFEVLECLDTEGERIADGDTAPECSELHYLARRAEG